MQKEEKKIYPSQLNTKAIACRVSTPEYVEILKEATEMGITVNDWLLMKIYDGLDKKLLKNDLNGLERENKEEKEKKNITDITDIRYEMLAVLENDWLQTPDGACWDKQIFEALRHKLESEDKIQEHYKAYFYFCLFSMYPGILRKQIDMAKDTTRIVAEYDSNIHYKKEPSVQDAITQLQLIAKEEFEPKDYRSFMKDLHELLSDLK
jgi:hypothetical protein